MKTGLRFRQSSFFLALLLTCILALPPGYASRSTEKLPGAPGNELAQDVAITGKVTSEEDGQGLPGVNVVLKGTSTGTVTDVEGNYRLSVPSEGATLVFSSVGYVSEEIEVGSSSIIDIVMVPDITALEEIVVIGYGTAKKSDLTGSVVSVKSKDLTDRPLPSVTQALQGKAPGVLVRTTSAAPGGDVSIIIRGHNSVSSGSQPLYVVDGVPLGDVSTIPTDDVESVEVLKDASSTAIYGSRGANGVVLITTKKGSRSSKPQITYSNRFTWEKIPTDLNLMNAEEFTTFYTEWELARDPDLDPANVWYNGSSYDRPSPSEAGEGTDWFDEITQAGFIQNHNISITGGGERNRYSLSAGYLDQKGMMIAGKYNRFTVKASNVSDLTDWLEGGLDLFVSHDKTYSSGANSAMEGRGGIINQAIKMSPALPVYDEEGAYQINNLPATQTLENPVAQALEQEDYNRLNRVFGNIYLNFKPVKDLNFKVSLGGDMRDNKSYYYDPTTTIYGGLAGGTARLRVNTNAYIINENILSYKKTINRHSFDVVGGFTYEQNIYEHVGAGATNFFTDAYLYNNLEAASTYDAPTSEKTKWSLASGLGRINYIFNDRYLLTATGRYDGSSKFGEGNKWGFFPSVAGAWRISNESFMSGVSNTISFMKLRASWGETGNQNIGLYRSLAKFGLANYPFGTAIQSGVYASSLQNSDLKWETTETIDIALEFSLWDRLDFTINYYHKKTRDLLMNVALVETSGFNDALMNVGKMENRGMEFMLDAKVLDKEFQWNANFAVWFNRNKITELNGDPTQDWKIGHPIGSDRDYIVDGILRTQEELDAYVDADGKPINGAQLGDYRLLDFSGPDGVPDGKITGEDRDIIFNPEPDYAFSFNNTLTWKNFALDVFFYGTMGNQVLNRTKSYMVNLLNVRNNMSRELLSIEGGQITRNFWTPENTNAEYARLGAEPETQVYVEDGSFLRLQNVMLTYNIPTTGILNNAAVYFSVQNVFTITDYTGWDPDVSSVNTNQDFGIDRSSYPIPRGYTLGLNITF
ncbi:MAG: TonB-dependent receptor [Cytophagales bacterium]|nr:TonB-dependent receptor [Cytophagales bacterium]